MIYLGNGRYAIATKNVNTTGEAVSKKTISELVKKKSIRQKNTTKPTLSLSSDSEPVQPAKHTLQPRLRKRHTSRELHSTSRYINYVKFGTDSNTEEDNKPRHKKPRVGCHPSSTRERSQTMITR